MKGYKMNFATKTLTITKAFAAKAMKTNSDEANLINSMMAMMPDLKIAYRTHSGSISHPYKGLTFSKMRSYIECYQNASELLIAFEGVIEIARAQKNPHNYVCKWFLTQFPNYSELPILEDGKIVAVEPINMLFVERSAA